MNTAEMWLKAQKDGKTYECFNGDMVYSKKYGLVDKDDFHRGWNLNAWEHCGASGLDELIAGCEWQEMDNVMTIKEAEQKFGIRIINA